MQLVAMSACKVYDISLAIEPGVSLWPGNPSVAVDTVKAIAQGGLSNSSLLHIGTHTAIHTNAPHHLIPGAPARVFLWEI